MGEWINTKLIFYQWVKPQANGGRKILCLDFANQDKDIVSSYVKAWAGFNSEIHVANEFEGDVKGSLNPQLIVLVSYEINA